MYRHTLLDIEEFCPVVKATSAAYAWSVVIGTIVLYGAQCAWAVYRFYTKRKVVSQFYATMIVFNILAMVLVTWRMTLCMPKISIPLPNLTSHNASDAEMFVTNLLLVLFPTHTCNNVCRLVYDVMGQKWAKRMLPVAWCTQGWLLIPANMGMMKLSMVFLVLTGIDYLQHGTALVFWSYSLCTKKMSEEQRTRYRACVIGVVAHVTSVMPLLVYTMVAADPKHWARDVLMGFSILCMMVSQHNWIRAAELTRPEDYTGMDSDPPTPTGDDDVEVETREVEV